MDDSLVNPQLTIEEYINVDAHLPTTKQLTDEEIMDLAVQPEPDMMEQVEEEGPAAAERVQPLMTAPTALQTLENLKPFFSLPGNEQMAEHLASLYDNALNRVFVKPKQLKITDMFK